MASQNQYMGVVTDILRNKETKGLLLTYLQSRNNYIRNSTNLSASFLRIQLF